MDFQVAHFESNKNTAYCYENKWAEKLLEAIPKQDHKKISELKFAQSNLFLTKENFLHAEKSIFEIRTNESNKANPGAKLIPNTCEIPAETSSIDLLLQLNLFSQLRMDQVYMICSEARRVIKPGGYWAMADHYFGANFSSKIISKLWGKAYNHRTIDLIHYISPEDWNIHLEKKISYYGISAQILVLQRI